jgi:hypothetical protein
MAGKLETPHVVSYKNPAGVEVRRLKLIFKGIKLETRYLVSYMKSPLASPAMSMNDLGFMGFF